MAAPTIAEYLSYASLQMAAEAFIRDERTNILNNQGLPYVTALTNGNLHASRFVASQAEKFAEDWQVLDQRSNTATGFSGTLFRRVRDDPVTGAKAGETVLSFRSTEFIDDAARDNKATNELEIKATGFAWGQIADMQAWYAELKAEPGKLGGGQAFSVTGYSLGGHLATAFNLLNAGEAQRVVTFNGAGVGLVRDGSLQGALDEFNDLRGNSNALAARFTEDGLADIYREIKAGTLTNASAQSLLRQRYTDADTGITVVSPQGQMLLQALQEIEAISKEAERVTHLVAGGAGDGANASPKQVLPSDIAGSDLDYRLAMQSATTTRFRVKPARWRRALTSLALALAGSLGAGSPLALAATDAPPSKVQQQSMKERQRIAAEMFRERCKKAGVFIHQTVEDVEGVFLMKLRPQGVNYGNQYEMNDPYGSDLMGGDGYILSFLKGYFQATTTQGPNRPLDAPADPIGYAYAEAIDSKDGVRYRYTGAVIEPWQKDKSYLKGYKKFILNKFPSSGQRPRYGVTYDDISTREERDYWIAGSSLKVIDLQTNEVVAERIGYMVDWAQGINLGGRSPWLLAADNACPEFAARHGATSQMFQTIRFVNKSLKTKGE